MSKYFGSIERLDFEIFIDDMISQFNIQNEKDFNIFKQELYDELSIYLSEYREENFVDDEEE